jgi:hypothetical protein
MASKIIVDQLEKTGGALTALTLPTGNASASEFLQNDGAGALSWAGVASGFSDVYSTDASATYTVPTDITKLLVIITGGGGSGAGGRTAYGAAGGGCSAGTVMARVNVVATDTIAIVIGAGGLQTADSSDAVSNVGGDSTFTHTIGSGSFDTITATGGKGGPLAGNVATAPATPTVGASNEGIAITGGFNASHSGGASFWGQGGQVALLNTVPSTVGVAFGSGGGGGSYSVGEFYGAAGADGVCFIMEFK